MLADLALIDEASDQLGFRPFVDAMSGVIDSPNTTTPLVISINAQWGAGKTSLGQLIRRRLDHGWLPHSTVWFDAWAHDDAPSLATALAATVAEAANPYRPLWRRFVSPLPSTLIAAKPRGSLASRPQRTLRSVEFLLIAAALKRLINAELQNTVLASKAIAGIEVGNWKSVLA